MSEIPKRPIDDVSFAAESVTPKPQSFAELMSKIEEKENKLEKSFKSKETAQQNETAENTQNQEKIKEMKESFFEKAERPDYKNEKASVEVKAYDQPDFKAQKEQTKVFPAHAQIDAESLTQINAIRDYFGVSAGVAMHGLHTAMLYDEN